MDMHEPERQVPIVAERYVSVGLADESDLDVLDSEEDDDGRMTADEDGYEEEDEDDEEEDEDEDDETEEEEEDDGDKMDVDDDDEPAPATGAPRFKIPARCIAAVEVPMVVKNLDRAINAFSAVQDKSELFNSKNHSIPFYLNPDSPWRRPVMSHGARSHNVVLRITVPKRTGRRRRKGTDGPWEGSAEIEIGGAGAGLKGTDQQQQVYSRARLDDPRILQRKLADNVTRYQVQPIGTIDTTHRFRRVADFGWNMEKSPFVQKYMDQVYANDINKMKQFGFVAGADPGPNVDIIPPPAFTHMSLPFNYGYAQNPYVRQSADGNIVNITLPTLAGHQINHSSATPAGPRIQPDLTVPWTAEVIAELEKAFSERPIWTRRALLNRVGRLIPVWTAIRKYVQYVAYQLKGGPWRDCMVKYGVDPRTDPRYRPYQSLMFQIGRADVKPRDETTTWRDARKGRDGASREFHQEAADSHLFDGRSYFTDGKVWQVCDITDPMLRVMLDNAAVRPTLSSITGWYHGGLWTKVKAIMRTKMIAIMFGRPLDHIDFSRTVRNGDSTPPRGTVQIQLPNLRLTDGEWVCLTGKMPGVRRRHRITMQGRDHQPGRSAKSRKTLEFFAQGGLLPVEKEGEEAAEAGEEGGVGAEAGLAAAASMPRGGPKGYGQVEEMVDMIEDNADREDKDDDAGSRGDTESSDFEMYEGDDLAEEEEEEEEDEDEEEDDEDEEEEEEEEEEENGEREEGDGEEAEEEALMAPTS